MQRDREHAGDAVDRGVRVRRRVDAERHADADCQDEARHREHDRVGQRVEDELVTATSLTKSAPRSPCRAPVTKFQI